MDGDTITCNLITEEIFFADTDEDESGLDHVLNKVEDEENVRLSVKTLGFRQLQEKLNV